MDEKDAFTRLLPCATMVQALLGPSEALVLVDSPAKPLPVPASSQYAEAAASFASVIGGSVADKIEHEPQPPS